MDGKGGNEKGPGVLPESKVVWIFISGVCCDGSFEVITARATDRARGVAGVTDVARGRAGAIDGARRRAVATGVGTGAEDGAATEVEDGKFGAILISTGGGGGLGG